VERTADALERMDWRPMVPPALAPMVSAARLVRLDLVGSLRDTALGSLRELPDLAEADPDRAERITRWLVHLAAWLDGQTDTPPPDLGAILAAPPSSGPATG
jgi:hypothetical protein